MATPVLVHDEEGDLRRLGNGSGQALRAEQLDGLPHLTGQTPGGIKL